MLSNSCSRHGRLCGTADTCRRSRATSKSDFRRFNGLSRDSMAADIAPERINFIFWVGVIADDLLLGVDVLVFCLFGVLGSSQMKSSSYVELILRLRRGVFVLFDSASEEFPLKSTSSTIFDSCMFRFGVPTVIRWGFNWAVSLYRKRNYLDLASQLVFLECFYGEYYQVVWHLESVGSHPDSLHEFFYWV